MAYKAALIALFLLIPPFLGYFATFVALVAIILAIFTISWHFMEKEAGWVSLGHSIPFGISAYLFALNPALLSISLLVFLLFLAFSLAGRTLFPFATFIASIALWQISHYFVFEGKGGEEGFSVAVFVGVEIAYIIASAFFLLGLLLLDLLSRSNLGLKINAIRDDELAAKGIGINPVYFRAIAFAISTTLASIAGIFYGLTFRHVSPDVFSPFYALFPFIASAIAFGRRWACLASSYLVVALSYGFSAMIPELHYVLYSAVLMLFAVVKRDAENL